MDLLNALLWAGRKGPATYTRYFALGMQLSPVLQSPFSFHLGCSYASVQLLNTTNCSIVLVNTSCFICKRVLSSKLQPLKTLHTNCSTCHNGRKVQEQCAKHSSKWLLNAQVYFLPQIVLDAPTFSIQCFMKNTMPSWLHLCFIYWISVVDVYCRTVETLTMKWKTVWLSHV